DKSDKKSKLEAVSLNLGAETKRGIIVVGFAMLAGVTALALAGVAGSLGEFIRNILKSLFGILAYLAPVLFFLIAVLLFKQDLRGGENKHFYLRTYFGSFLLIGSIAGLIHLMALGDSGSVMALASEGKAGGYLGALFAGSIGGLLGFWAGSLVLLALLVVGLLVTFD